MSRLTEFLRRARAALSCHSRLHVVLGNEACDLDSAVSAITYAFFLSSIHSDAGDSSKVIPVLNIPREDFPLRTEVNYWLSKHGVSQDSLTFRDEVPLHDLHAKGGLQLTLVDHNVLPSVDQVLEPAVSYVIDHHKLERQVESGASNIFLQMVGSCSTLVAERILETKEEILDPVAASLLHGTILLDTVNLNESAKRVTPKDVEIIKRLEAFLESPPDRSKIFEDLTTAKSNISLLTSEQLLRKDRKVVSSKKMVVAMSSLPMMVKEYLCRADAGEGLQEHVTIHGPEIVVLMGIKVNLETVTRDLAIYSPDEAVRKELSDYLSSAQSGLLELSSQETPVPDCLSFHQHNHTASRKVVLPLIKEWLNSR